MQMILAMLLFVLSKVLMATDLGKKTYDTICKTCHAPRVALGIHAPAAFDNKAWAKRFKIAAIESKANPGRFKSATDYLLYKVSIGKGLMPHGGLCKEANVPHQDCSDKAIVDAIYYMAGRTVDN